MAEQAAPPPSPIPAQRWIFPARYVATVDGDTIDVIIDQGMHSQRVERLRLLNVNAPEMKGATLPLGREAKAYTLDWLEDAWADALREEYPLVVETHKSDAFGRYLAMVWRKSDGACLNDDLLSSGHARVDIR